MISALLRFIVAGVVLGLVVAVLYGIRTLPPEVVSGLLYLSNAARGLDRILPVHESLAVLAFEVSISLVLLPVWIVLRLWKRFSPVSGS